MAEFDPKKLAKNFGERMIHNEKYGDIRYTPLLASEVSAMNEGIGEGESKEYGIRLAWKMFNKSHPEITFADWEATGIDGAIISGLILEDMDFQGSSLAKP